MKASDFIAKFLELNGIKYAFGMSGGAILHFVDSLYHNTSINIISGSNEQFSAFEADGYARSQLCQLPGICFATSGPGATNLITGIASAYYDSVPMIVFTGQVARHRQKGPLNVRQLGFQELPSISILKPIVKGSYQPQKVEELPNILVDAWELSMSGRKGPVHIDLADDLQRDHLSVDESMFIIDKKEKFEKKSIDINIVNLISASNFPLLIIGNGSRYSSISLRRLLDRTAIPCLSTWAAIDIVSGLQEYLGVLGTYSPINNFLLDKCDLIVSLGCRLSNNIIGSLPAEFAERVKKIVVDIDPNELAKLETLNIPNCIPVLSDIQSFIDQLEESELLSESHVHDYSHLKKLSIQAHQKLPKNKSIFVLEKIINNLVKDDRLHGIFLDTGNNLAWCCNILSRTDVIIPPTFSSWNNTPMGYSIPGAIGFCLGSNLKPTLAVIGDGGLGICLAEISLVVKMNLPLLILLIENGGHNIQKQTIDTWLQSRYSLVDESSNLFLPSYDNLGSFFGIRVVSLCQDSINIPEPIFDWDFVSPLLVRLVLPDSSRSYPIVPFGRKITDPVSQ